MRKKPSKRTEARCVVLTFCVFNLNLYLAILIVEDAASIDADFHVELVETHATGQKSSKQEVMLLSTKRVLVGTLRYLSPMQYQSWMMTQIQLRQYPPVPAYSI